MLEPKTRCTTAAAAAATSIALAAAVGVAVRCRTAPQNARKIDQRPTRRTGLRRSGKAVSTMALGMASPSGGKYSSPASDRTEFHTPGSEPVTISLISSDPPNAITAASTRSRSRAHRRRYTAATSTSAASTVAIAINNRHRPIRPLGRLLRNETNARSMPGCGTATAPSKARPRHEPSSRITSVARRASRGWLTGPANRRVRRKTDRRTEGAAADRFAGDTVTVARYVSPRRPHRRCR